MLLRFVESQLEKKIDDVLWFDRVGDVADIDKVYIPTVPAPKQEETYGIANERHPFRMWTYVFVPKGLDRARTNIHGGAIAIGHPLAASGTRITLHLLHALRRAGKRYGLGSACIGGGQGAAVIVEAL